MSVESICVCYLCMEKDCTECIGGREGGGRVFVFSRETKRVSDNLRCMYTQSNVTRALPVMFLSLMLRYIAMQLTSLLTIDRCSSSLFLPIDHRGDKFVYFLSSVFRRSLRLSVSSATSKCLPLYVSL